VSQHPWDDEPVGDHDAGTGVRRQWRRGWHQYAAVLLGMAGAFVLIGALPQGAVLGSLGGACLLLASFAVVRADGPRATLRNPAPRRPSSAAERTWYAVLVVAVLAAALLLSR
jgi:drug/metabolite transporter (DMT)-like permease